MKWRPIVAGACALLALAAAPAVAQEDEREPRVEAQPVPRPVPVSPLTPGKLDLLYRDLASQRDANIIWWTPSVKAGAGIVSVNERETDYFGGFVRPFAGEPRRGDLIVGAQAIAAPGGQHAYELQGEYRLTSGWGVGAGFLNHYNPALDVRFGKVTFRNRIKKVRFIFEAQAQSMDRTIRPGGYAALYDDVLMTTIGTDGEQWRASFGYVSAWNGRRLKPTLEILHVDANIGSVPGAATTFINGTLKMRGQFLSHAARLGRAMGPQGLEYGNPLGFLSPMWNRRLDTWELGSVACVRYEGIRQPNGASSATYDAVVFPYEILSAASFWARLFGGASRSRTIASTTWSLQGGYYGPIGRLTLSARVFHEVETRRTGVGVGLLHFF